MMDDVNRFYDSIPNGANLTQAEQVAFFVYFLTNITGQNVVTAGNVKNCFTACDLTTKGSLTNELDNGLRSEPPKYVRGQSGGYRLHRRMQEILSEKLNENRVVIQTSTELRALEDKLPEGIARDFLKETIDCFEAGANRATIIMAWILAIDHLSTYVFEKRLEEFNTQLRVEKPTKAKLITHRSDLTGMSESNIIKICLDAKIIDRDIWKILSSNLEYRNSCAHPSNIEIPESKAIAFLEDLVKNVILKFKI